MKIGRRNLEISTPEDLDEKLIEQTGVSAREMRDILNTWCSPSTVASALLPLLKEPPSRPELGETIAKAGVDEVRADVRGLYEKALTRKAGGDAKKGE